MSFRRVVSIYGSRGHHLSAEGHADFSPARDARFHGNANGNECNLRYPGPVRMSLKWITADREFSPVAHVGLVPCGGA